MILYLVSNLFCKITEAYSFGQRKAKVLALQKKVKVCASLHSACLRYFQKNLHP